MCDEATKKYIKETMKHYAENIRVNLQKDLSFIKDTSTRTEKKVDTINGNVKDNKDRIRDLEEKNRAKYLECPNRETIDTLKENLLTSTALKKFIKEEKDREIQDNKAKEAKTRWIVAAIGVIFTILNVSINILIFYLERNG